MRRSTLILALSVSTIGLLVVAVVQQRRIDDLRHRRVLRRDMDGPPAGYESEPEAEPSVDGPERDSPRARDSRAPSGSGSSQTPARVALLGDFTRMMDAPEMKELIQTHHRTSLDVSYGPLLNRLQLQEEDVEALKELMTRKQAAMMDVSLKIMMGSRQTDAREYANQVARIADRTDEAVRALLGPVNYDRFQEFENTQSSRMQVGLLKRGLSDDNQIDELQETELILALREEQTSFPFTTTLGDPATLDPSDITEEAIVTYVEELQALQQRYIARAGEILTPSQLEQFRLSQKQQQMFRDLAVRMALRILGDAPPPSER